MPELPEVETIRKGLNTYLVGHIITHVDIRLTKQITGDVTRVTGAKVIGVRRFGKGLIIDLSNEYSIAVHVKMTGQLIYGQPAISPSFHPLKVGKLPGPYTHVIFHFDKHARLYYNDVRQFGWIQIVPTARVLTLPYFKSLGPEPLRDLTREQLKSILAKKKIPIKPVLMDQKAISGIGNIYANDALFLAKIHPKRIASSLSKKERERLFAAIESVLQKGIAAGGASEWHYVNALGQTGEYQHFFQVYGKTGTPCSRCKTPIMKITLAGRGTFFCPTCQQ